MKIMIIGSAGYMDLINQHLVDLEEHGHEARKAAYDDLDINEYGICSYNRDCIKWADVVHVFWDGRSIGTQFDIGMAFALGKPILLVKLNTKSLRAFVLQYERASQDQIDKLFSQEGGMKSGDI